MVPPHLRVLPVRGGEEDPRRGQGDPEDPQAAEDEGEEGDQNPAAGSVTLSPQGCLKRHEELPAFETKQKKQKPKCLACLVACREQRQLCEACVTAWA